MFANKELSGYLRFKEEICIPEFDITKYSGSKIELEDYFIPDYGLLLPAGREYLHVIHQFTKFINTKNLKENFEAFQEYKFSNKTKIAIQTFKDNKIPYTKQNFERLKAKIKEAQELFGYNDKEVVESKKARVDILDIKLCTFKESFLEFKYNKHKHIVKIDVSEIPYISNMHFGINHDSISHRDLLITVISTSKTLDEVKFKIGDTGLFCLPKWYNVSKLIEQLEQIEEQKKIKLEKESVMTFGELLIKAIKSLKEDK